MSVEKIAKKIQEINRLKEEISSCKDDVKAIELQTKIIGLLQEVFEDKESLAKLSLLNQQKNKE